MDDDFEISYSVEVDGLIVQAISFDWGHEYRILKDGHELIRSKEEYGQRGIALRDGLIKATDPLWLF